ncbi:hypothetical protein BKH42_03695 [Helicobacter sp. 13S00482-2]|uniref:hypothetical protein n=1 Tax=Helicobacter sp. 13S00482-2 TaxID=1476200 RepID=UPI000BA6F077|nr:hypothetical protein [Helicobacter sp. 13S00482-2]PAF53845.1 hypothetical protein BKH42_03695 [Helicobacter sp. 13S00482-2]
MKKLFLGLIIGFLGLNASDFYKITDDNIFKLNNQTLHQIKALKDFSDVKKGDLGGYIESEKCLSDKIWLEQGSYIFNCGDSSFSSDDSRIVYSNINHSSIGSGTIVTLSTLVDSSIPGDGDTIIQGYIFKTKLEKGRLYEKIVILNGYIINPPKEEPSTIDFAKNFTINDLVGKNIWYVFQTKNIFTNSLTYCKSACELSYKKDPSGKIKEISGYFLNGFDFDGHLFNKYEVQIKNDLIVNIKFFFPFNQSMKRLKSILDEEHQKIDDNTWKYGQNLKIQIDNKGLIFSIR